MKNHILIIDDEWVNRELYKEFLVPYGYRVSMARDGEEGLEMAFTSSPDLIILDIRLPKISGCKVYDLLRGDDNTKKIPIIIVSAHNTPNEIMKLCDRMPKGDIYTKPINHRKIKARIDELLGRRTTRVIEKIDG